MDAIILQDICIWIMEHLPRGHHVTSLSGALDPVHLLAVIAQVLPFCNEPSLSLLSDVQRETELHVDSVEALLTIYINTCRRLGMRCLFAPHSHPALASLSAAGVEARHGAGAPGEAAVGGVQTDLHAVLRNVSELRALLAARQASLQGAVDVRVSRPALPTLRPHAPSLGGGAGGEGGEQQEGQGQGDAGMEDEEGEYAPGLYQGHDLSLTWPEHVALYTGRLGGGVTPRGRARLWQYLLQVEPEVVQPLEDTATLAAAAKRRVTDAQRAWQLHGRRWEEGLVLAHTLSAPGCGLLLTRRRLLKQLIRAGVPPRLRGHLWLRLAGAGDWSKEAGVTSGGGGGISGEAGEQQQEGGTTGSSSRQPLLHAVPASEVAIPPPKPTQKRRKEEEAAAASWPPPALPPLSAWPAGEVEASGCTPLLAALTHYDRLLLLNAHSLGPEGLPMRLHALAVRRPLTAAEEQAAAEGRAAGRAGQGDGHGAGPVGAEEPPPLLTAPRWLQAWALDAGHAPATLATVRQVDADLRRTMPHLWPMEVGRVTTEGEGGIGVKYVYSARHPACGGPGCEGPGRLCRQALQEQFTVSASPALPATPAPTSPTAAPDAPAPPTHQVTVSQQALRRILLAYASHVPALGYCQGLNFVAAHALRWCAEPDALCLLSLLVSRLLPAHSFTDLTGTAHEQSLLQELLVATLPALVLHVSGLASGKGEGGEGGSRRGSAISDGAGGKGGGAGGGDGMDPSLDPSSSATGSSMASGKGGAGGKGGRGRRQHYYQGAPPAPMVDLKAGLQALTSVTLRWFMSLYCLPFHAAVSDRVWDSLCWEGRAGVGGGKVMFRAALALLRLCSPKVLACRSFAEAMQAVEAAPEWAGKARVFSALWDCWVWPPPGALGSRGPALPLPPPASSMEGGSSASAASLPGSPRPPARAVPAGAGAGEEGVGGGGGAVTVNESRALPLGKRGRGRRRRRGGKGTGGPGGAPRQEWGHGVSTSTVAWLLGGPSGLHASQQLSSVQAGGRFGRAGMGDSSLDDAIVAAYQGGSDDEDENDEEEEEEEGEGEGEEEEGEREGERAANATTTTATAATAASSTASSTAPAAAATASSATFAGLDPSQHPGLVWRERVHVTRGLIAARRRALVTQAAALAAEMDAPILKGEARRAAEAAKRKAASADGSCFPVGQDGEEAEQGGMGVGGGGGSRAGPGAASAPTAAQAGEGESTPSTSHGRGCQVLREEKAGGWLPDAAHAPAAEADGPGAAATRPRLLALWYPAWPPQAGSAAAGEGPAYTPVPAYFARQPAAMTGSGGGVGGGVGAGAEAAGAHTPGTPIPAPVPAWALELHSAAASTAPALPPGAPTTVVLAPAPAAEGGAGAGGGQGEVVATLFPTPMPVPMAVGRRSRGASAFTSRDLFPADSSAAGESVGLWALEGVPGTGTGGGVRGVEPTSPTPSSPAKPQRGASHAHTAAALVHAGEAYSAGVLKLPHVQGRLARYTPGGHSPRREDAGLGSVQEGDTRVCTLPVMEGYF